MTEHWLAKRIRETYQDSEQPTWIPFTLEHPANWCKNSGATIPVLVAIGPFGDSREVAFPPGQEPTCDKCGKEYSLPDTNLSA